MFLHSRQPIQPGFYNNINRFMYSPQQRLLQCFLFRIKSHVCLLNNTTNTRRRTQSTLPPTEYRIFGTFDTFCTFHPSLHESVATVLTKKQQRCFLAYNTRKDANVEIGIFANFDLHITHFFIFFVSALWGRTKQTKH